ncbi:DUF6513 domain-containing protein [Rubinisphaera brasiliensis]|uniref:Dihydropteroate synthase DHPS n=1 Tax=Rubinisphaera brasiliensis (strain ATCC 49424 / DSM 5305 / JCM 21570 / IAM 15109 / NBRC 103401 / IFAM 1448) TaxID=756272 RepID=F0SMX0_RUBBR|nr:DUF6513 domain-containing protein [Rubinisphaera brasiliensis]ADY59974.1 dihydropteroate synthase DHPS [Rubinisphaera brasiliensis DSM 5305]
MSSPPSRILFVTGKLAEPALRQTLAELSGQDDFEAEIVVLGISVAALMHVRWISRKLELPEGVDRVILPGWCQGDISQLEQQYGVPFERGPKDLRDLPRFFSRKSREPISLDRYDIEILAEINHAPLLADAELMAIAERYREAGADRIDYGCIAGEGSAVSARHVKLLVDNGFSVSIDSFDRSEVQQSVAAGASLVLSGNSSNVDWLAELDVEVVVIPDDFDRLETMQPVIDKLQQAGNAIRLDPILEPIGFRFFNSLQRYAETRRLWPDLPVMMGIGNVTELSEVDSAGVNFLLIAICQELGVTSILTTEVINWARTSVQEIDFCRRLLKYALAEKQIPKHIDSRLVRLRDPYVHQQGEAELAEMATQLRDPNFRVFSEPDGLHLMNRTGHFRGEDPFELMAEAMQKNELSASHAFYLGYELAHAETARQLGKQYVQDEALNWGDLSRERKKRKDRHAFREADRGNAATNDGETKSGNAGDAE